MTEQLKSTREYKRQLELSLERARLRLSPGDFAVMSVRMTAEISHLATEIDRLRIQSFMGCGASEPVFPKAIRFFTSSPAVVERKATAISSVSGSAQFSMRTFFVSGSAHVDVGKSELGTMHMEPVISLG